MARPKTAWAAFLLVATGCGPAGAPGMARGLSAEASVPWEGCPTPADAPVGDGGLWLQFAPGNVYCARTDLAVDDVVDELTRKAWLHLVPGDYFLPLEPGSHEIEVPSCSWLPSGVSAPSATSLGVVRVARNDVLGQERVSLTYQQGMTTPAGEDFLFRLELEGSLDELRDGILLDGRPWPTSGPRVWLSLCPGAICDDSEGVRVFGACQSGKLPKEEHRFDFEGGTLTLQAEAQWGANGLEGTPLVARGTYLDTPFFVEGYWDLVMRPTYAYDSARDYVVRFPEPLGEVCGLVVYSAWPYANADWGTQAFVLGCDGKLEARALLDANWEQLEPAPQNP